MKPKRPKKPKRTLAVREHEMREAISNAFKGVKSRAHFKHLADALMAEGLAALSIAEDKSEDVEPMVLWADDPAMGLIETITAYAEFTKTPLDELIGHTIGRIPQVGAQFFWN